MGRICEEYPATTRISITFDCCIQIVLGCMVLQNLVDFLYSIDSRQFCQKGMWLQIITALGSWSNKSPNGGMAVKLTISMCQVHLRPSDKYIIGK